MRSLVKKQMMLRVDQYDSPSPVFSSAVLLDKEDDERGVFYFPVRCPLPADEKNDLDDEMMFERERKNRRKERVHVRRGRKDRGETRVIEEKRRK